MESNIGGNTVINQDMKDRIINEIKLSGKTQKEFAEAVPIHPKYFSAILNGHKAVGIDIVNRMAEILSVRPEYLLCKDEYRTEEELLAITGILNHHNYRHLIDFLDSIGIDVRIEAPKDDPSAQKYRVEGIPYDLSISTKMTSLERPLTHEQVNFPYTEESQFLFIDRNTGKSFTVSPRTAGKIINQFKDVSYKTIMALLEIGGIGEIMSK